MLTILIFIISLIYADRHRSISYLLLFHFVVLVAISIYVANGIDVQFKADPGRPSDTYLYYSGYMSSWDKIGTYMFAEYPYFLRILSFPIVNSLFAVWGQSALTFLLLDIIVKNKRNLILFITFHALIYTCTNMFKDNLILLIGLGGYIALDRVRNLILQCSIIFVTISMIAWVRPFLGFAAPLALFPILFRIRSVQIKNLLLGCCFIGLLVVLYLQRGFIQGVMNAFANDSSVIEGRSPAPIAILKVLFGPTPFHYFFSDRFFVQPFLPAQSLFFGTLHYLYYIGFAAFGVYIASNFKTIFNLYRTSIAKICLLLLSLVQMFVYIVIYGSADIRQRGVILTFLFIFCLGNQSIFKLHYNRKEFLIFLSILCALTLLTFIDI